MSVDVVCECVLGVHVYVDVMCLADGPFRRPIGEIALFMLTGCVGYSGGGLGPDDVAYEGAACGFIGCLDSYVAADTPGAEIGRASCRERVF